MFSLSWFTTIPGILITVGVLLLIIALVIFIVTNKKGKKEKGEGVVAQPNVNVNATPAPAPSIVTTNQPPVDAATNTYGQVSINPMDSATGNTIVMPTPVDVSTSTSYASTVPSQPVEMQSPMTENMNISNSAPSSDMLNAGVYSNSSMSGSGLNMSSNVGVDNTPTITTLDSTNTIPVVNDSSLSSPYTTNTPTIEPTVIQNEPVVQMSEIPSMNPVSNGLNTTEVANDSMQSTLSNNVLNVYPEVSAPSPATIPSIDMSQSNVSAVTPSVEQVLPEMQPVQVPNINTNVSSPILSTPNVISEPSQSEVVSTSIADTPIYGGVSTIIPEKQPEVPHQIYGGANPLESTQQVPISQITSDLNNTSTSLPNVSQNMVQSNNISTSPVSLQQMPSPVSLNATPTVDTSSSYVATEPNVLQSNMSPQGTVNTASVYSGISSNPTYGGTVNQNMQ